MVERHGIAYHEKELGQLFCDLSAKLIVQMLVDECRQAGARIEVDCVVSRVDRTGNGFAVETNRGPVDTDALVVASGGLSIPKMGATGFGYELAKRFDHSIVPTRAALVPLTFGENELAQYRELKRHRVACRSRFQRPPLCRPYALHSSWHQRPGDPADIFVLAGGTGSPSKPHASIEMSLNGWRIDSGAVPTPSSRPCSANRFPSGWRSVYASWH